LVNRGPASKERRGKESQGTEKKKDVSRSIREENDLRQDNEKTANRVGRDEMGGLIPHRRRSEKKKKNKRKSRRGKDIKKRRSNNAPHSSQRRVEGVKGEGAAADGKGLTEKTNTERTSKKMPKEIKIEH